MKVQKMLLGVLLAGSLALNAHCEDGNNKGEQQDSQLINRLYQREWVRLDENGNISGRVAVIENSGAVSARIDNKVVLAKEGRIVQETKTDKDGVFELKGVQPGTYALHASGDYTLAAFALHVLPSDSTHLASNIDVYATTIANRVMELTAGNVVPSDLEFGGDEYYRTHDTDPIAVERIFNRDHQVLLQDGNLVGRVSRPGWAYADQDLSGTFAQIVKNGQVISKVQVGKDGYYQIEKLPPGIYDMVISGNDGFAAFRFQAVTEPRQDENVATRELGATYVAARLVNTVVADTLNSELIHQSDVYATNVAVDPVAAVGCETGDCGMVDSFGCGQASCCGGGYAGGGGFGGGGGGGGFGGGGFLGLAGLAGGIVALATSGGGTPPPPTPIAP